MDFCRSGGLPLGSLFHCLPGGEDFLCPRFLPVGGEVLQLADQVTHGQGTGDTGHGPALWSRRQLRRWTLFGGPGHGASEGVGGVGEIGAQVTPLGGTLQQLLNREVSEWSPLGPVFFGSLDAAIPEGIGPGQLFGDGSLLQQGLGIDAGSASTRPATTREAAERTGDRTTGAAGDEAGDATQEAASDTAEKTHVTWEGFPLETTTFFRISTGGSSPVMETRSAFSIPA